MIDWGGILSAIPKIILRIWDYFDRKRKERKEAVEKGKEQVTEGVDERDPSKITSGFDRINRE